MNWFSKELGGAVPFSWGCNGAIYVEMRAAFHALRDELSDYGARDMIDIQSFVWVAFWAAQKNAVFDAAFERLRTGLADLANHHDLLEIEKQKDEVIERYGADFLHRPSA